MQKLWISKKASSPTPSCRCAYLFKDPGGISAASLIEEAKIKQIQKGSLRLDQKNPNFLIAEPSASSRDAVEMIEEIKTTVRAKTGVDLEVGIEIW